MLRRIARFIVHNRKGVLAIAGLLLVVGVFGMMNASINYDMLSYLPDDLSSVKGFAILSDDFALGNTAQIVVVDSSDAEILRIKERLETVQGIEAVSWVSDFEDLAVPQEFWATGLGDTYFTDDSTFMQVSFTESANDPLTRTAVTSMREILASEDFYIAGTEQLELEDVINADRTKFGVAALGLVSIALFLTVPSVIVPILFVLTIGAAVVVNLGMSFYLGQEMSYLTGVIVFALQFAVTMDYALFLYHRYEEERAENDNETAMEIALASTFKSVIAAAMTTTAGFLALTAMRLGFGADMGIALARGVVITVLAVLTILPALMLTFDGAIRRYAHKVHLPNFAALGGWLARHAKPMTLVFLVAFVPALWGYSQLQLNYNLDESLPDDLPAIQAAEELADRFGRSQTYFIILEDIDSIADIDRVSQQAKNIEGVTGVFSYTEFVDPLIPEEFVPPEARESLYADGYTYVSVDVDFGFGDERTDILIANLRAIAETYPAESYVTGQSVLFKDMEETSAGDVDRVNWISIVAIAIIIAIVFRSISIPLVLLATIELAILMNQAFTGFGEGDVIFIATLAIGAIQLGATVDYAIILTSRYQEELAKRDDREAAMRATFEGAAPSILVSASTMFAATIGLVFLSSVSTITDLTLLIARGAVISFFVVLFLLPPLLVIGQSIFERTSIGWPRLPRKR